MNWAVRDAIQDDVIPVWNLVLIVHLFGVELSFLDPSVKHWDDKKRATWMTRKEATWMIGELDDKKRALPSWMETNVSYFHDIIIK